MNYDRNTVWYDDITVDKVYINKNGGIHVLAIKQGIPGYQQHKYDNNPRYGGSNGTYVDRYNSDYIPVEYEVILQVVVRWDYKGETCERIRRFNVTSILDMPRRMTDNGRAKIENYLRSKKYTVSHDKDTRIWYLHTDDGATLT